MRRFKALMMVAALGVALSVVHAEEKQAPDATLKLEAGSIAAGIGISWGKGTLTFQGKDYPVDVKGLSVGDVGATSIDASGKVYHLKSIKDFNGNYAAVGAGATVAGGGSASVMKNQAGVTIEMVATTQGLKFALGGAGVDMKIKE
jgi:hypothetical protein